MIRKYVFTFLLLTVALSKAAAQEFFNLTADEVRIDSVLPVFTYQKELGLNYADSVYEVTLDYPEFIDMSKTDVARLKAITQDAWPEMPQVHQYIAVSRKHGLLDLSFVPIVQRDGKLQKLVSFQLNIRAKAASLSRSNASSSAANRYASHSVLASGTWAKISVAETGVHQLSDDVIRQAGFSNPSKVKIYGYGGALQPEKLTGDYLVATDDLKEVPTCYVNGRRLFYAVGPVNWNTTGVAECKRNNYSTLGYYFLTESDDEPATISDSAFVASFYPSYNDYHSLYELEEFSWFHGGRKLFARTPLSTDHATTCTLQSGSAAGVIRVAISFDGAGEVEVLLNDSLIGTFKSTANDIDQYSSATVKGANFNVSQLNVGNNTIALKKKSGYSANMRLDYVMLTCYTPKPQPNIETGSFPTPKYVYHITNQDLHAHGAADMIIIIPTTQKLREQAERLKTLHEQKDGMTVRIIPADELYNEFSSGTPDANAYRRYLKMLYDRATTDEQMPRYLLLLGDCAWDNRMLISEWSNTSTDDFLLCYESENSFSETACYISDDYFCLLDDNEEIEDSTTPTASDRYRGKPDVAVGRLSARTAAEAKIMVDKIENYYNNEMAGSWQNTLCFMGDDGNKNIHMDDAEKIIAMITENYPAYNIKKVYWDAYKRTTTSTGNGYPDVTRLLKQQMQEGALIMNYTGHGGPYCLSHEQVLWRADFASPTSLRLPLWITASCDIMPFDGQEENIGETAMTNPKGGAIAFFGTTRTVFVDQNRNINRAFMKHVLETDEKGKRISIGEAARLTKNDMINFTAGGDKTANKLQYSLLGDPALVLAAPTLTTVIDSINGKAPAEGMQKLYAGQKVTVKGHIEGKQDFNGQVTATVRDVEEFIVCRINNINDGGKEVPDTAFYFTDRPSTIYVGSDSVQNGQFTFTFAVPKDISYSDDSGLLLTYAVNNDKTQEAHGEQLGFVMGSSDDMADDGVGPNIYCYLNSADFTNGATVNSTPYFYAELNDKDGINASGSGIGHDLELIVDGQMNRTYNLNSYFKYNFGDYQSGTVGFSIPELSAGAHTLLFRAWDAMNNSSTAQLSFVVDPNQAPGNVSISCTQNPASTTTSFIVNHNRTGSQMDVTIEIFDTSGRKLWEKSESGVPTDQTFVVDWDLTVNSGSRLSTGVYLYRAVVSTNGSAKVGEAKKLIIVGNK